MHVVGLMPVYEEANWVEWAVKGVIDFVDELIISEGYSGPPWHFNGHTSADGTINILQRLDTEHEKVELLDCPWDFRTKVGRKKMYNEMLNAAELSEDPNWLFIVDADEFYTGEQLERIRRTLLTSNADLLRVCSRTFAYNFEYYVPLSHFRLIRHTPGMYFRPTQKPTYRNGELYANNDERVARVLEDEPMFHYSFVRRVDQEIKRRLWEYRIGQRGEEIFEWIDDVFLEWTYDTRSKVYRTNERITGNYGFLFDNPIKIDRYEGEHPDVLADHPYRNCSDIRKRDPWALTDEFTAKSYLSSGAKLEHQLMKLYRAIPKI